MSDTDHRPGSHDSTAVPRAVIHKHILDVAAERPDASMAAIADAVSGASVDLVEAVLVEYGDPAGPTETADQTGQQVTGTADPADPEGEPMSTTDPATTIDEAELTEKQRETILAIADDPDASQADLADRLGVSRATINQRVNGIDGFDWADREAFVEAVIGNGTGEPTAEGPGLAARVERLEDAVGERNGTEPPLDPALAHKVIRTVVRDEAIDADEELAVIRALVGD